MHKINHLSLKLLWAGLILLVFSSLAQAQYENGSLIHSRHQRGRGGRSHGHCHQYGYGNSEYRTGNGSGDYEVPSVRAGLYRISAAAAGFATAAAENITVSVGNRQRIDLTLKPGQATTTVEVSDVSLQLETDSSQRGQTITNYQSTPPISSISGGVPTSGGQISSIWKPRIIQFGLKVIY
jgi:Carboxypeptidase regulatory-like domain